MSNFAPGPGLQDDISSNQKSHYGYILECLAMEDVGVFYGQLVYFMSIWYIFWSFGMLFPVLVCYSKKNLATLHWSTISGWQRHHLDKRAAAGHEVDRAEPDGGRDPGAGANLMSSQSAVIYERNLGQIGNYIGI
jgi:hypothetical protein